MKKNIVIHPIKNGIQDPSTILYPQTIKDNIIDFEVKSEDINSESVSNGTVLTANGSGKASFEPIIFPVTDVQVDGSSVLNNGVASISLPSVPVTDVQVNGNSVVSNGTAQISIPVGVFKFIGEVSTKPSLNIATVTINGNSVTAVNGNVVLWGTQEFAWDGSKWVELGDETKQNPLTAGANIQINGTVISATDTTYNSLSPSENGVDVSLVTTGEKYNWNSKQNALPTVGSSNYNKYLHTNSSNGALEWSTVLVTQDLTSNTAATISSSDWTELKADHFITISQSNLTMTGLNSDYEFVNIKLSINSVSYYVKLCKNELNKYSGLFFIEESNQESTNLYELTVYYNGTQLVLRCAKVC